jgi:alcohol dehydrogenase class IV
LNIKWKNDYEIAQKFIKEIKSLLQKLDIENKFEWIKESDFNEISKLARKQSTFSFPVTHLMSDEECKNILKKIQK